MICLKILDKNGVELNNGDTIRVARITPDFQYEDDGYKHQIDTIIKWEYDVIDPENEIDACGAFWVPGADFSSYTGGSFRDALCGLFALPASVGDEEFNDCVLGRICHELRLECTTVDELEEAIQGFEIVPKRG